MWGVGSTSCGVRWGGGALSRARQLHGWLPPTGAGALLRRSSRAANTNITAVAPRCRSCPTQLLLCARAALLGRGRPRRRSCCCAAHLAVHLHQALHEDRLHLLAGQRIPAGRGARIRASVDPHFGHVRCDTCKQWLRHTRRCVPRRCRSVARHNGRRIRVQTSNCTLWPRKDPALRPWAAQGPVIMICLLT